jgi:hypothetical protein
MAHTIMSTTSTPSVVPAARRIPLWLKLAYTAFMAVLVPVYLRNYGPTNFLYFCDVALIITLVGIWIESPLLVSICAVGIIASQTLWVIDFLSNLIGHPLTGLTDYSAGALPTKPPHAEAGARMVRELRRCPLLADFVAEVGDDDAGLWLTRSC